MLTGIERKIRDAAGKIRKDITMYHLIESGVLECELKKIMRSFGINLPLYITTNPDVCRTACTNGEWIMINPLSSFAEGLQLPQQFALCCGMLIHELGHLLFTNFVAQKKATGNIRHGVIPFTTYGYTDEDLANVAEITEFIADAEGKGKETSGGIAISKLFNELLNITEDSHIEPRTISVKPGWGRTYLGFLRQAHAVTAPYVEDFDDTNCPIHIAFGDTFLHYAKFGILQFENASHPLVHLIEKVNILTQQAVYNMNYAVRAEKTWHIFVRLWKDVFADIANNDKAIEDFIKMIRDLLGAIPTGKSSNSDYQKDGNCSASGPSAASRKQIVAVISRNAVSGSSVSAQSNESDDESEESESSSTSSSQAYESDEEDNSKNNGATTDDGSSVDVNDSEEDDDVSDNGTNAGEDIEKSDDASGEETKDSSSNESLVSNSENPEDSESNDTASDSTNTDDVNDTDELGDEDNTDNITDTGENGDSERLDGDNSFEDEENALDEFESDEDDENDEDALDESESDEESDTQNNDTEDETTEENDNTDEDRDEDCDLSDYNLNSNATPGSVPLDTEIAGDKVEKMEAGGKTNSSIEKVDIHEEEGGRFEDSEGNAQELDSSDAGIEYDDEYIAEQDFELTMSEVEALLNKAANQLAIQQCEKEFGKQLSKDIHGISFPNIHKNVRKKIHRASTVSPYMKQGYNAIVANPDVKQAISALTRYFESLFKVQNYRSPVTSGIRLDKRSFRNEDITGKIFYKEVHNQPRMCLAIRIDESASMSDNNRAYHARISAVIIQAVCEKLRIPVLIYGDISDGNTGSVDLFSYSDFDSVDGNDKYRLVDISARNGCNRDGAALYYLASRLAERPEEYKILLSISDGQPNSLDYSGDAALEDIKSIVQHFRQKGIVTFGAAIGEDKDKIQKAYGQGFLDVTDIRSLPVTLYNIIRAKIKQ